MLSGFNHQKRRYPSTEACATCEEVLSATGVQSCGLFGVRIPLQAKGLGFGVWGLGFGV